MSEAGARAMRLIFTKGSGKYDLLEITRAGSAPQRIECPKQGIIPHDMVHYAVESTVAARGFLRRVEGGESAGFRMDAKADSDAVERLVEVFQGDAWSGGTSSADDMLGMYRVTCAARDCPVLPVDAATILAVRDTIKRLGGEWDAIAVGGSLELFL